MWNWCIVGALAAMLGLRLVLDRLDRGRIREELEKGGRSVLDITWNPFGRGWLGERSDRLYEVTYRTQGGKTVTATCKTTMYTGVYWASSTPPSGFSRSPTDRIRCLRCRASIPESGTDCKKCGWSYRDQGIDAGGKDA